MPDSSEPRGRPPHEALTIRIDHHLRAAQPDSLEALARHGAAIQPTVDDVRVLYAAESARAAMGLPRPAHQQRAFDTAATNLREALGDAMFNKAADEGTRLTLDAAVSYAPRPRPQEASRERLVQPDPHRARRRPSRRRRTHEP